MTRKYLPKITIEFLPAKKMRYDTTDDYVEKDGQWFFYIQKSKEKHEEFLALLHGLTEAYLCWKKGISFKEIDKFDFAHPETDNPGELKEAPYYVQHKIAEAMEVYFVHEMNLWKIHTCR